MSAMFGIMKGVLFIASALVWGIAFAAVGAFIGYWAGGDRFIPYAAIGMLVGMLVGAMMLKRKIARIHPEVFFGLSSTGTLDDCRYVRKKNGKWVLRWSWHAPANGTFAGGGTWRKKRWRE